MGSNTEFDLERLAAALGREEAGEKLLSDLDDRFAAVYADHPEFADTTAATVITYDATAYYVFTALDGRGAFVEALGFTPPEATMARHDGESFSVTVSPEEVALFDGDLVMFMTEEPDFDPAEDNALFDRFDAEFLAVTGADRWAISINNPVSITYALDSLVPDIAAALGR
nr:ABC transporter substrate-binding protein [Microbacterium amylolyticum]